MMSVAALIPSHHWHRARDRQSQSLHRHEEPQHQQESWMHHQHKQQHQNQQRQSQTRQFELLVVDLHRRLNVNPMENTNELKLTTEDGAPHNTNDFKSDEDEMENAWKDFEAVVATKRWENILRERLSQGRSYDTLFGPLSSISVNINETDVDPKRAMKFLKVAMEMAVRRGNLCDVRSLFLLVDRYGTSLDEDGSSVGSYLSELMAEAVADGRVDIVTELVNNGANPNQPHKERSHLSRAVASGTCPMIAALIRHGANPNEATSTGKTILHEAASSSTSGIINCLLDNGACPGIQDKIQGNTPLHTACSYSNREAIFAIYNRGAEFNSINHFGDTPLAKLLRPLTKAENFHNATRLELAQEVIKIGFTLAPRDRNKTNQNCLHSSLDNKRNTRSLSPAPITSNSSSFLKMSSSRPAMHLSSQRTSPNFGEDAAHPQRETETDLEGSGIKSRCDSLPSKSYSEQRGFKTSHICNSPQPSFSPRVHLSLSSSSKHQSSSTTTSSVTTVPHPPSPQSPIPPTRKHFASVRARIAAARSHLKSSTTSNNILVSTSDLSPTPEVTSSTSQISNIELQITVPPPATTQESYYNTSGNSGVVEQIARFGAPTLRSQPGCSTSYISYEARENTQLLSLDEPSSSSSSSPSSSSSSSSSLLSHQHHPTKEDRMWDMYSRLLAIGTEDLSLQQRCRLTIIHCLGTRPLVSSLNNLGLPNLVIHYLRHGGR